MNGSRWTGDYSPFANTLGCWGGGDLQNIKVKKANWGSCPVR